MNLLLKNSSWAVEDQYFTADIRISRGVISEIGNLESKKGETSFDLKNHFLYPGLINSHDHLEMNLYPLMGRPPYQNYTEWARDIYKPKDSPVKEIESLNINDRLMWGGIKNLLSGVNTVVHHNPWHRILGKNKFPVKVLETPWAHSLAFEKNLQQKFKKAKNSPFVIHAAEGVDDFAKQEILQLNKLGLLKNNSVLIHAVGVDDENLKVIQESDASVVWCPSSNLFMFGRTAPVDQMRNKIRVALGTDSTMTGSPTLFDEIRAAKKSRMATAKEIYEMVTSIPAKIFHLEIPEIKIGKKLNGFISPIIDHDYYENIFSLNPSLIKASFIDSELRFADKDFASDLQLKGHEFSVSGKEKWIAYDILSLKEKLESKTRNVEKNSLRKLIFNK